MKHKHLKNALQDVKQCGAILYNPHAVRDADLTMSKIAVR